MSSDYTITIASIVNNNYTPNTTLTPVLQAAGNASIKITGYHLGDGTYRFSNVDDGNWHLYSSDGGTKIEKWGGTSGRWIGDDNLEVYAKQNETVKLAGGNTISGGNAFVSSAPISYYAATTTDGLVRKDQMDNAIATAVGNGASLTAQNTWTAKNIFNKGITLSGSTSDYNHFYNGTNLHGNAYCDTPVHQTSVSNRGYVDAKVDNLVLVFSASGYQESINTIRLAPAGSYEPKKVYLTYGSSLDYASSVASIFQPITVEIKGTGNANYINMSPLSSNASAYSFDYVSYRGIGSNITLKVQDGMALTASTIGTVVYEDIYFMFTESMAIYHASNTNIIFKNCKFYCDYDNYIDFYGCQFLGANYFDAIDDNNHFTFTECFGERIFTNKHITVTGTKQIQYYSSTAFNIGTIEITGNGTLNIGATTTIQGELNINRVNINDGTGEDPILTLDSPLSVPSNLYLTGFDNTAPEYSMLETLTDAWGNNDGIALTSPPKWLIIKIDGNRYSIPCYSPKT